MDSTDIRSLKHDGLHEPTSIEERIVIESAKALAHTLYERFQNVFDDARDLCSELDEPIPQEVFDSKHYQQVRKLHFTHNGIPFRIHVTSLRVENDAHEGERIHDGPIRFVKGVIAITVAPRYERDVSSPYGFPYIQIEGADGKWDSFEVLAEMPVSIPVEQGNTDPDDVHREFMRLSAITDDPLNDPELGTHALVGLNDVLHSATEHLRKYKKRS
jgi:hypothetical protein